MAQRLLLACPDREGIVAQVTGVLADCGANLLDLSQHSEAGMFAMRAVYTLPGPDGDGEVRAGLAHLPIPFTTKRFSSDGHVPNVAILCSAEDHCLTDLMWRFESGDLNGKVTVVASNHYLPKAAIRFPVFQHVPAEDMPRHESALLRLLKGADVVILARYMRILSEGFLAALRVPVINIHHSFLPAFVGIDPYEQAHERGVKLVGATAHYVVPELDAGPIIEQDVVRVTHRDTPDDLRRTGRDVERVVLARAVRAHLEDRVAVMNDRTVIL